MGRETSERRSSSAGLLFMCHPYGMFPPSSPTRSGFVSRAARGRAASMEGTGKQRRPDVTAVIAVVIDRMTSTATTA